MRQEKFFAMKREVQEENEWRYRPENIYIAKMLSTFCQV